MSSRTSSRIWVRTAGGHRGETSDVVEAVTGEAVDLVEVSGDLFDWIDGRNATQDKAEEKAEAVEEAQEEAVEG